MLWKDGLTRENGVVRLRYRANGGREGLLPIAELGNVAGTVVGHSRKLSLDTNFDDWRPATSSHFVELSGLRKDALGAHRIFQFAHEGKCFMVPAEALISAFFRPMHILAPYLFMPQGLEKSFSPTEVSHSFDFIGIGPKLPFRRPSIQSAIHWYWSFPSARRLWASVYHYSKQGIIGCDLPRGSARIAVRGRNVGKTFLVASFGIVAVDTQEKPYDFAAGTSQRIVFHESDSFRGSVENFSAKVDQTILSRGGQWTLSDTEWTLIEPLFPVRRGGPVRRHPVRTLLDGIIAKLGTGAPWKKAAFQTGTWMNASELYRDCRKDGRWAEIHEILARTRGQTSESV